MGKKITKADDLRKPKHGNDTNRPSKGEKGQRTAATVRRLKMYNQRATRDKKGKLIHQDLQSKELPTTRIQPDRRWFGNTRVIGQKQLEQFRDEMASKVNDSYSVLIRERKLPLSLLEDPEKKKEGKQGRANLLTMQPFKDTFGPGAQRKRPRLAADDLSELATKVTETSQVFDEGAGAAGGGPAELKDFMRDPVFAKGQSKRIWGELYKVLDSSDVVVEVLDARDPNGTRCRFLEQHIRKNLRHKHLVLVLNKCDLVPAWVTKRWLHTLSREFPTIAFHASVQNPFGKGALLSVLRQLARLRSDKPAISVGFVGYPNVGKSSVINTLKQKEVCKSAPVPGETKVWQYVTLMKRVFLIDCPGVVYNKTQDSEADIVLKGVVRVESLEDAAHYISDVLARVKPEYMQKAYQIRSWKDSEDFLEQMARRTGKLVKGGEPDLNTVAKMVLHDWQRGRIPFFTLPPGYTEEAPGAGGKGEHEELPNPEGLVKASDVEALEGPHAARAAEAVNEELVSVMRRQVRQKIPVQQGYYAPADEGADSEGSESESDGEEEEEEEEGAGPSGSGDEGGEEKDKEGAAAEDSGDESDGYEDMDFDDLLKLMGEGGSRPKDAEGAAGPTSASGKAAKAAASAAAANTGKGRKAQGAKAAAPAPAAEEAPKATPAPAGKASGRKGRGGAASGSEAAPVAAKGRGKGQQQQAVKAASKPAATRGGSRGTKRKAGK